MGKQLASCLGWLVMALALATPGLASPSALMQAPARNAAIIAKVPGFKSADLDLYIGKRQIVEGLVIRKSRIENGKIIIPPAGMYYSSRIASIGTMTGIEMMLLGKRYAEVNELFQYIVLKDRKMKLGESLNLLPDGSRALQFVSGKGHPYGNIADSATLRIMKASGNFYGTEFTVAVHPTLKDINSGTFKGIGKPEGHYLVDTASDLNHNTYVGASVYPSGQSYLMVNANTAKQVDIKEFATPSLTKLWLTATPRLSGEYAKGQVIKFGKGKVEVVAVSPQSVKLRLVDAQGRTLERSFDNLNDPHALDYLPSSPADRAKYQMASSDDTLHVQLAMLKPGGPVNGDKVSLDLYSDVFTIGNPQPWPGDTRFLARPDT